MPSFDFAPAVIALIYVLVFIIAVLWTLLPFAVFGTKGILREILAEQKLMNALLVELSASFRNEPVPTDRIATGGRIEPKVR